MASRVFGVAIWSLLFSSLARSASAQTPATRPTAVASERAAPATQSSEQILSQVVDLMRAGKSAKASQLLDKVYNATPAAQRTRPMLLNRAILDLSQKSTIMRGIKDLSEYLAKHRAEDEQATNVLAACLNLAAYDPKLKAGTVWQSAFKEWDRRNYLLDHSHPGWRRWGAKWVSDEETKQREAQVADLRRASDEQADYIDKLMEQAYTISEEEQAALDAANAYSGARSRVADSRTYLQGIQQQVAAYRESARMYPTLAQQYTRQTGKTLPPVNLKDVTDPVDPRQVRNLANREDQLYTQEIAAAVAAQQIGADLAAVYRQILDARAVLAKYHAQLDAIRPEWPQRFEPVDASATDPTPTTLPAAPTISPNVAAANAQAAAAAAAANARNAVFPASDPAAPTTPGATAPPPPPQQQQQQKQQSRQPAAVGPGADLYGGGGGGGGAAQPSGTPSRP